MSKDTTEDQEYIMDVEDLSVTNPKNANSIQIHPADILKSCYIGFDTKLNESEQLEKNKNCST